MGTVAYQEGTKTVELDKEKLGFKKSDNVTPILKYFDADFFRTKLSV